ncbi:uncharacterized protein GGS22DRAFT_147254 [Annulohypoxylon maeteangense]|uniref:uncharacterized protein n=1 Tax=Annulohypoxylon maeteangense TaxID=1927788 RepID=UPI002007FFD6|nr:uncharacterized protein GGS22DRAFT_147254 [Annulohypoxylon maeteangense]KAI0884825.1 hypothetical protein GGS22DRAFT_147254 [Annulohypoxylon maeteangense]
MSSTDESSALVGVGESYILDVPPEVLLKVMEQLTPTNLSNFVLSCKSVFVIFEQYKHTVMINVLQGLPEFDTMLYLLTAHKDELHPARMLRPRIIDFNTGLFTVNLMHGDVAPNSTIVPCSVTQGRCLTPAEVPKYTLKPWDLMALWNMATVIDWWVELFPRVCWRDAHLNRRCLRGSEELRVRKAVAHWWLYAHYHHGFTYNYRNYQQPKRWSDDTRLQQIRTMSTNEIYELNDLWGVVKLAVSADLCSSPERVCVCKGNEGVDLVPWGQREYRHQKIVDTYSKLSPEQLKYYLIYFSNWKRVETAREISQGSRDFSRDTETLSVSIRKVIEERVALSRIDDPRDVPRFGILDGSEMDSQHASRWMNDAWPDGKVPLTRAQIDRLPQDQSALVVRGDDGTDACCPY